MKTIKISELRIGDIFTNSLDIKNRDAFIVEDIERGVIKIKSRNTSSRSIISTSNNKFVIWLRNEIEDKKNK